MHIRDNPKTNQLYTFLGDLVVRTNDSSYKGWPEVSVAHKQ